VYRRRYQLYQIKGACLVAACLRVWCWPWCALLPVLCGLRFSACVACSIAVLFRLGAGCFLFSCTCIYDGTACTLFIYLPISKKKNFLKLKEFIWKFRIHTTIDEIFTFNCSCFTALNLSLTEVNCIKFKIYV
jgi:hypothetical protein